MIVCKTSRSDAGNSSRTTMRIKGKVKQLCSSCTIHKIQVVCMALASPSRRDEAAFSCPQVTRDMGYQEVRCTKDPRHAQRTKWRVRH